MADHLPLAYTEAIIAVAEREPALAACLIHHHDCIESVKSEGMAHGRQLTQLQNGLDEMKKMLWGGILSGAGTLVLWCAFLAWQVLTHPNGFTTP